MVVVWEEPRLDECVDDGFGGWVEVGGVVAASPCFVDPDVDLGVGEGGDLVAGVLLFPLVDVVVGCVFPLVGVGAVGSPVGAVGAVDGEEGLSVERNPAEDWFAVGGLFEGDGCGWGFRRVERHWWWCPFGVGGLADDGEFVDATFWDEDCEPVRHFYVVAIPVCSVAGDVTGGEDFVLWRVFLDADLECIAFMRDAFSYVLARYVDVADFSDAGNGACFLDDCNKAAWAVEPFSSEQFAVDDAFIAVGFVVEGDGRFDIRRVGCHWWWCPFGVG